MAVPIHPSPELPKKNVCRRANSIADSALCPGPDYSKKRSIWAPTNYVAVYLPRLFMLQATKNFTSAVCNAAATQHIQRFWETF